MAIFPGFLFRKFYYTGEFTKQFNQSNEFDKLLWNVFFSGLSLTITFISLYIFGLITGLEILESLSYDNIGKLLESISSNKLPGKDVVTKTYKALIIITLMVYSSAIFFAVIIHWLVRTLGLDVKFSLFRFKNYWYYYIHGGKILYNHGVRKKLAFTAVDVLCDCGGETKLYSGILSQYTIDRDNNNLENIFLTNASALKQKKDDNGNTISVTQRPIPGAAFCIPYSSVLNMNLRYVYEDTVRKPYFLNIFFAALYVFVLISVWFDLSKYGINGIWNKMGILWWSLLAISSLRLLIVKKDEDDVGWVSHSVSIATSIVWILHIFGKFPTWAAILSAFIFIVCIGFFTKNRRQEGDND